MSTPRRPAPLHALLALAVALSLFPAACGSIPDQAGPTTTTFENSTTVWDGASATLGTTATTTVETTTTATEAGIVEIVVEGGEVVSGPERIQVGLDSTFSFVVVSDVVDHVHVHGYDIHFDLVPGSPKEIRFTADIPGIFEVELEESHLPLVELEVG